MLVKIFWNITRLICLFTLICYIFGYFLLPEHWSIGFILLAIQICIVLCFLLTITWLFNSKLRAFYPFAVLLLGFPFLKRTVQFHTPNQLGEKYDFSMLSYNVSGFYSNEYYKNKDQDKTVKAIRFASDFDADIKCFQDFYNWDETPITGSIKRIIKKGSQHFVAAKPKELSEPIQGMIGLIIFSRYPLIYVKQKMFATQGNGILVADMVFKKDTFRIINTQLQSTGVRVNKMMKKDYDLVKKEGRNLFSHLKIGFKERIPQIKLLTEWINESPYPVILAGDFNEVPYGYAYGKISKKLKNSFEAKGYGFGFTLNRSPRFVRIDNQFFGKGLMANSFETLFEVENSDHYPLFGQYSVEK
jgi:endonuclease/exonuclease/phosphatase (EEP) superfamily protein YafD